MPGHPTRESWKLWIAKIFVGFTMNFCGFETLSVKNFGLRFSVFKNYPMKRESISAIENFIFSYSQELFQLFTLLPFRSLSKNKAKGTLVWKFTPITEVFELFLQQSVEFCISRFDWSNNTDELIVGAASEFQKMAKSISVEFGRETRRSRSGKFWNFHAKRQIILFRNGLSRHYFLQLIRYRHWEPGGHDFVDTKFSKVLPSFLFGNFSLSPCRVRVLCIGRASKLLQRWK